MLEQVLMEIHNWFYTKIIPGTYTIENGGAALPFLQEGQYFRIIGSVFNDGLHQPSIDAAALYAALNPAVEVVANGKH